jgi:hypothetical protein
VKTIPGVLAGVILSFAFAVSAFAQYANDTVGTRQWTKPDGTQVTLEAKRGSANVDVGELRAFQNAKAADTSIAAQLAKNPKLIASESYVSQHPELGHFLEQYPNAREDIQRNPGKLSGARERFDLERIGSRKSGQRGVRLISGGR